MGKYRKKPVVIEARQWDGTAASASEIVDWILSGGKITARYHSPDERMTCTGKTYDAPFIAIDTLEGTHKASPSDWIIKGVQAEFYPCKPDIFEVTYEVVE